MSTLVVAAACASLIACGKSQETTVIETTLLAIAAQTIDLSKAVSAGRGGAIEVLGNDILGVDSRGQLFHVSADRRVSTAPSNIETNARQYDALDLVAAAPVKKDWLRVIDIAVRSDGSTSEIILSHTHYQPEQGCLTLRVSSSKRLANVLDVFANPLEPSDWQVIFESRPCLPLKFDSRSREPVTLNGYQAGGRLLVREDRSTLVSVGEFANNGVDAPIVLSQDDTVPYGKIVRLVDGGDGYEIISKGHRNPQGLTFAGEGVLYATEHGPKGGDELNVIASGQNYGWPLVTLGTNYHSYTWPLNANQGRHDLYRQPLFAWLPSIAVSSLVEIKNFAPEWRGDLLIAALIDRALWRTRVTDGRVVLTERIPVGSRVRDLIEKADHEIVLWTDDAELITLKRTNEESN